MAVMVGSERRRHVRLKPTPDLPVRVALVSDGPMREMIDVVDISVGGFSLSSPALQSAKAGERLKLQLMLGLKDEYAVEVVARWVSGEGAGVELVEPPVSTTQALGRYIAELLERGGSS